MIELKNPFAGVRLEFTRSHPLTKAVVIALIVLFTAAMVALTWSNAQMRAQIEEMRQEAAQLEAENADLSEKLDKLGVVNGVQDVAQDELGLVDPDTIIIDPEIVTTPKMEETE